MSIIQLPAGLKMGPECGWGQQRYDLVSTSDATGSEQTRLLGPPRWTMSLVQPAYLTLAEGGAWAAMQMALRGKVNRLEAWDPVRLAPQGTARGTLVLASAVAAGATSISLSGARAGNNLLRGTEDMSAVWAGTVLAQPNYTASPNGNATASLLTCTIGSGASTLQTTAPFAAGSTIVVSGYFKRSGGSTHVRFELGNAVSCWFNLQTGAVNTNGAGSGNFLFSAKSIAWQGNGWYRCVLTITTTTTTTCSVSLMPTSADATVSSGSDQVYAWGLKAAAESADSGYEGLPTLKPGDMLRIGSGLGTSQCLMTMGSSDTIADAYGAMTVATEPPARIGFASGTAVAWDKPTAFFRNRGGAASSWKYGNRGTTLTGLSLDLLETWS